MLKNKDIAREFAQNGKPVSNRNMKHEGDRLFSYNTVIAQKLPDGRRVLNLTRYSNTTSDHQYLVRQHTGFTDGAVLLDNIPINTRYLEGYVDNPRCKYMTWEEKNAAAYAKWAEEQRDKKTADLKRVYKEKQYAVFEFGDGTTVRYDMARNVKYNSMGKAVKSLAKYFRGHTAAEIVVMVADEKFAEFLAHIYKKRRSRKQDPAVDTFLSMIGQHNLLEQYFLAGVRCDDKIRYPISTIPRGLLWLARNFDLLLTNPVVESWAVWGNVALQIAKMGLGNKYVRRLLESILRHPLSCFRELVTQYRYEYKTLANYIIGQCHDPYESLRYLRDYARMMSALREKYEKYPKYLEEAHRNAVRLYNSHKQTHNDELFAKRIDRQLGASVGKYEVIVPETPQDVKDEGVNLRHCVGSYVDRIVDGDTQIAFLRRKSEPDKSLVTIEVQGGKIVQAKGAHNRSPDEEESAAIAKYARQLKKLKEAV